MSQLNVDLVNSKVLSPNNMNREMLVGSPPSRGSIDFGARFSSPSSSPDKLASISPVREKEALSAQLSNRRISFSENDDEDTCILGSRVRRQREGMLAPATPNKRRKTITPQNIFQAANESASLRGTVKIKDVNYDIAKMDGAKGDYQQCYSIVDRSPVQEGVPNDQFVVKVFHEEKVKKTNASLNAMRCSLQNYHHCLELGFPIATIFNVDTALSEGYYLVERIPFSVKEWIEAHPEDHDSIFEQIKAIFDLSLDHRKTMDLLPANFRVKEGRVFLIDLLEEDLDKEDDGFVGGPTSFDLQREQALRMWATLYPGFNP